MFCILEKLGEIFTVDDFCLDENARSFSDCFLQKMGVRRKVAMIINWECNDFVHSFKLYILISDV